MGDRNDRLYSLVCERHKLEARLAEVNAEIEHEVTNGEAGQSLPRLIVKCLGDGEKKIGDVVRCVMQLGYKPKEKGREIATLVSTTIQQLRNIKAVECGEDRNLKLADLPMSEIMDKLRERYDEIPKDPVDTAPSPPPPEGRRRGRPPGSKTRRPSE